MELNKVIFPLRIRTLPTAAALLVTAAAFALASEGADRAKADLAKRLNLKPEEVAVVKEDPVTWPNGALGLQKPDEFVTQAIVPGSMVELKAKNTDYLYTTGGTAIRFGGPIPLRKSSMLHLEPKEHDPNLNGDLVQTSMLGDNPKTLIQGVSDYVPFRNGAVMATRRTSRSGFDLLYLAPGATEPQVIAGAFALGAYALDEGGTAWAAVRRRMMGLTWEVAYSDHPGGDAKIVELPGGKVPSRLLWSRGSLLAQTPVGWYRLEQTWTKIDAPFIEADHEMMLSKSQTLVVDTVRENGKTVWQVVKLWFTGKRDVVATIPGENAKAIDLVARRWLLVTCKRGDEETVFVVDIATGLVMPSLKGRLGTVRAFIRPAVPPVRITD